MLICIDGLDGAGKSTVANALLERLQETDTVTSVKLRHLPGRNYNDMKSSTSTTMGMALFYIADMADAIEEDIELILSPTDWVVWDRGIFSTLVYQLPGIVGGTDSQGRNFAARQFYNMYIRAFYAACHAKGLDGDKLDSTANIHVLLDTAYTTCIHRLSMRDNLDAYESVPVEVWARRSIDYNVYFRLFGHPIINSTNLPVWEIVDQIWKASISKHIRSYNG